MIFVYAAVLGLALLAAVGIAIALDDDDPDEP